MVNNITKTYFLSGGFVYCFQQPQNYSLMQKEGSGADVLVLRPVQCY